MFRLIYNRHQADRENKSKKKIFTAVWEVWDLQPLEISLRSLRNKNLVKLQKLCVGSSKATVTVH